MVFEDVHRHLGLGPLPLTCSVVVIIKMILTGKQTKSWRKNLCCRSFQTQAAWLEVADTHSGCFGFTVYLGRSQGKRLRIPSCTGGAFLLGRSVSSQEVLTLRAAWLIHSQAFINAICIYLAYFPSALPCFNISPCSAYLFPALLGILCALRAWLHFSVFLSSRF